MSTNTPQDGGVSAPMPSETWWQRYERLRDEFGEAFGTGAEEGALEALDEHVRIFDSEGRFAMEEYREITDRLQQCVQRHRLGLGGERIDVLVCDEVDRLRAAHQERDADARRLDWLEGWMQDGCFQMDMMDLCYGSDSVRAAIDAARAPADTQTEGNDAS